MPTKVENFALWKMADAFVLALKKIKQTSGYNSTPSVQLGALDLSKIPAGSFPALAIEMGDLKPDGEQFGGVSTGRVRFVWDAFVWGFVTSNDRRGGLYRNASGLLADLFAALWTDETLPDANGSGTTLFVDPGEIVFDMESYSTDSRGYFLAKFGLVADITRGGSP